jgi:hypothetical protein
MAIQLGTERTGGTPVLSRTRIGEQHLAGLIRYDQRNILKNGQPVLKDNGKPRQELVVTLLAYDGDMTAGIGGEYTTPTRGDVVRLILKGGAFGQWIDAVNTMPRPLQVGDMVWVNTTHAIRYESMGANRELGQLNDQDDIDYYKQTDQGWLNRRETLGYRGELRIRAAKDTEAGFVVDCETKYLALQRQGITLHEEPGPFDAAPATPAPAPVAATAGQGINDLW